MIVLRLLPQGGTCFNDQTLIPVLTIYRDGTALTSDGGGYYCDSLPSVSTGRIDPTWAAATMDRYFSSAAATLDMTTLDGSVGVADGMTTDLTYTRMDGARQRAAAYVLDLSDLDLSPEQTAARAELSAVLDELKSRIVPGSRWTPESLRIVKESQFVPDYDRKPIPWPTRTSRVVESVLAGQEGSCGVLTGSDASAVRKALGTKAVAATWLIDGRPRRLAIGVVIPGLDECSIK